MNINIKLSNNQIASILERWFEELKDKIGSVHFWERDKVAKTIKNGLQENNQWARRRRTPKIKEKTNQLIQLNKTTKFTDNDILDLCDFK